MSLMMGSGVSESPKIREGEVGVEHECYSDHDTIHHPSTFLDQIHHEDGEEDDENEEDDEEEEDGCLVESSSKSLKSISIAHLGPALPLKDHIEKDKDDDSLRRWKEHLLGTILLDSVQDTEPEVKVLSLCISSSGRPDIAIKFPLDTLPSNRKSKSGNSKEGPLFTLKEGSCYILTINFTVQHNIVPGLTYVHTVWKNGLRVDNTRVMLGTFAPRIEPYIHMMEEETTPSGILARGSYSARTKLIDDDGRCHWEIEHKFDIRKDW